MVRGHWRQQACGPNRTLRKRIFVAEHSAGPSDKPLRVRPDSQVVHVLRGDDG